MKATAVAAMLRTALEALELEKEPELTVMPIGRRYYTRATAPIELRAWDRAIREIPAYRPGREILVLAADLHRWIESQPVDRAAEEPANDEEPLPYEMFAGVRK